MALMKKFKVEGIGRVEQVERELSEAAVDQADIDYLVSMLRLVFLLSCPILAVIVSCRTVGMKFPLC